MNKNNYGFLKIILAVLLGIIAGIQLQNWFMNKRYDENVRKFSNIISFVEENYVDSVDTQVLIESAIKGMFDALDPHTVYIPENVQEIIEEESAGKFEGIGVEFQIISDTITIVSPIIGGPSEELGIQAGDRIIKIMEDNSVGLSNSEVMDKLRGEKGSQVDITIYRPSNNETIDYRIVRDEIPINSVEVSLMYNDSIGYVSLSRFAETSDVELFNSLSELKQQGMKNLILDLRNNPGGLLNQAFRIADFFISENKLIVYTKGRINEYDETFHAMKTYPYENIPLIILINRGSASASEIVAGAIQDWDRGLLVGETSFGKGLVQRPLLLDDNSAVRVTISKYFTPSGRAIQRDYSDKKEYYNQLLEADVNEGNNFDHTTKEDTLKPVYKTYSGRTVYGGGGITPDYLVKSTLLQNYAIELRRKNVYYQFIRKYMDKNGKHIRELYDGNLRHFKKKFEISENEMKYFITLAAKNGVKFNAVEYKVDKIYIKARLKSYIAREIWRNEGWYLNILGEDKQFMEAVDLFYENARFDLVH